MIVLGGIHGNEPSGIEAALRVRDRLLEHEAELAGDVVFVAGNLHALERDRRFIDLDLNRQWTPGKIASLGTRTSSMMSSLVTLARRLIFFSMRRASNPRASVGTKKPRTSPSAPRTTCRRRRLPRWARRRASRRVHVRPPSLLTLTCPRRSAA